MPEIPCACRDYCGDVPEDQDRPGSVCKLRPGQPRGCPVCQSALIEASTRRLGPFLTCSNERCDQHGRTLAEASSS